MPDKDKADKRRKMVKRVETKEDGRFLIYYTFEDAGSTCTGADSDQKSAAKAVRK